MINNCNTHVPQWKLIFHLGMHEYQSLDCKDFYPGNAFLVTISQKIWLIFKNNYLLQGSYDDTKLVKTNKHTHIPVSLAIIFPNNPAWF